MSEQSNLAIMILDHKKKVFPAFRREEQVQFYGKRGFSLIGLLPCF